MQFTESGVTEDYSLFEWTSGQYKLQVSAFAFGQYRVQMWWAGPVGHEFRWPDMVPPNF